MLGEKGMNDLIFDTHAHYDDEAFDEDREELLASLCGQGVGKVVNIAASVGSDRRIVELMEKYDFIYGAIGVHPGDAAKMDEAYFEQLKKQCLHEKCVAVGEIGLDYYWPEPDAQIQKVWFERQLELAREVGKPVVIHSRDAAKDTVDIMKAHKAGEIGGVVHCYSYTKETAREFLDMDFYFGIGGVVTFKNSKKLKEAVEYIPMDKIVLETDCPYLSPDPFRGKRNSSLYLTYVVDAIAELKQLSAEEVRRCTWENAHRLYRMSL